MRLLDTIAVALTTGNFEDVFATAFDKRNHIQPNAAPGEKTDDMAAATKLIFLIGNPAVSDAMDLFTFLMRRWWSQYQ